MFTPNIRVNYKCEVLDGGAKPKFSITADDDPNNPIICDTAGSAWKEVFAKINIV